MEKNVKEIIYYDNSKKKYKSKVIDIKNIDNKLNQKEIKDKFLENELENIEYKIYKLDNDNNYNKNYFPYELKITNYNKFFYIYFKKSKPFRSEKTKTSSEKWRYEIQCEIPSKEKKFSEYLNKTKNPDSFLGIYIYSIYKKDYFNKYLIDKNNFLWFIVDGNKIKNVQEKNNSGKGSKYIEIWKIVEFLNSDNYFTKNETETLYAIKRGKLKKYLKINKNEFEEKDLIENRIEFKKLALNYIKIKKNEEDQIKIRESELRAKFRSILLKKGNQLINSNLDERDENHKELLVASHIWSFADIKNSNLKDNDKIKKIIDENNGILVPYYFDKLFDRYFIAFDENLELWFSDILDSKLKNELFLDNMWKLKNVNFEKSKDYFDKHYQKAKEKWERKNIKFSKLEYK